jgi:two-component system chemotaxis response regulator CheY
METPLQKTCLVVDDSSIVRRMAGAMFRELGYDVSEAANGLRAVEHCKEHSPDVVLLDWNMPVMDGLDCLRTLRGSGTVPSARIMLCTSESSVTKIQTVLEAGADEYIIKPFDREVLRDKLILLGLEEPA